MIVAGLVLGACTATPAAEDPAPSAGGYDPNIQPTASTWIYSRDCYLANSERGLAQDSG
jgi:hypothetical protein